MASGVRGMQSKGHAMQTSQRGFNPQNPRKGGRKKQTPQNCSLTLTCTPRVCSPYNKMNLKKILSMENTTIMDLCTFFFICSLFFSFMATKCLHHIHLPIPSPTSSRSPSSIPPSSLSSSALPPFPPSLQSVLSLHASTQAPSAGTRVT